MRCWLLAIAEPLDEDERHLAATIVYRALLGSVLERGKTAAYHHGARYLMRLEAVAPAVNDWKDFSDHPTYVAGVRETHGRKRRFWQIFEKVGAGDR